MASFYNALLGLPNPPQPAIYWGFSQGYIHEAVRIGNLKAVRMLGQPLEVFDVAADPGETTNIAVTQPEIVSEAGRLMAGVCTQPKHCHRLMMFLRDYP